MAGLAIKHLSSQHPEKCPICEQNIDYKTVAKALETKLREETSSQIKTLTLTRDKLTSEISQMNQGLSELKKIAPKLESESADLANSLKGLSKLVCKEVDAEFDFEGAITSAREEISRIDDKKLQLKTAVHDLEQKQIAFDKAVKLRDKSASELKDIIGKKTAVDNLVSVCDDLISASVSTIGKLENTSELDSISERMSKIETIVDYLNDTERAIAVEAELPTVNQLVESLEEAGEKLDQLEGSLEAIRQVTTVYEKEAVTNELISLSDLINSYYSEISGHPIFNSIQLVLDPEEAIGYSVIASGEEGSTRIPTRFSNAQMNIVGISLFLANNSKLATDLAVVLMDDPTQSMDPSHKESLAKVVSKFSKKKQTIIATQDNEFRNLLEKYCKPVRTYELQRWSKNGIEFKLS